jgi:putative transposase
MKLNAKRFTVEMMSRALGVSRGGYYKWLKISDLGSRYEVLDDKIKIVFEKSKGRYGSPRVCQSLNNVSGSDPVSRPTVARRMKVLKLAARPRKRYTVTTDSKHDLKISDNLLNRQFKVQELNKVWVSDLTYIWTDKGWRYLTSVIDLADRAVVGWALSETMHASATTVKALKRALEKRAIQQSSGLMFHSDRGVQYASEEFRSLLDDYQITQSMSRKGNCWDNAVAESFFKTIKTEEIDQYEVIQAESLQVLIFRYIEGWYNTVRIHSALNGKTPLQTFKEKIHKHAA